MSGTGIIGNEKIENAKVAILATWNDVFPTLKELDAIWDEIATTVPMSKKSIDMKWIGDLPQMQKWLGERKISELQVNNYIVTAQKWANGVKFSEDDVEDDELGFIIPKVKQLATMAIQHRVNRIVNVLIDGFNATPEYKGYDAQPLFSAAHKHMGLGAAQTNIVTGEPSVDDAGAIDKAFEIMGSLVDAQGEPLGMQGTILIHGPKTRSTVAAQLLGDRLASGASNPNFKLVRPVMSHKLIGSYANYWFLVDGSKGVGPVLWGQRRAVRFRVVGGMMGGQESELSFKEGGILAGADYRGEAVPGLWETIVGSRGTA